MRAPTSSLILQAEGNERRVGVLVRFRLRVSVSLRHRVKRTSNSVIGPISKVAARPDNRALPEERALSIESDNQDSRLGFRFHISWPPILSTCSASQTATTTRLRRSSTEGRKASFRLVRLGSFALRSGTSQGHPAPDRFSAVGPSTRRSFREHGQLLCSCPLQRCDARVLLFQQRLVALQQRQETCALAT